MTGLAGLLAQADPAAPAVERHLWLVNLLAWVRADGPAVDEADPLRDVPWPVRRLRHLLSELDHDADAHGRVSALLRTTLASLDPAGLLADFGFAPRQGFVSELGERLRLGLLPGTPQTHDLGELFQLVCADGDATWLAALDDATLLGLAALCTDTPEEPPQAVLIEALQLLASQMRATGLAGAMRQRIDPAALAQRPFHELARTAEALRAAHRDGADAAERLQQAQYLRAVLQACVEAADSVRQHLDEHGISVDLVFQIDQLRRRRERMELLLDLLLAPRPASAWRRLVEALAEAAAERRGLGRLLARHYALLARKVTERSAETGEHYITRDRAGWLQMLRHAAGGGAVIGFTTLAKFALGALALPIFWAGLAAGLNYAISFVLVQLLHWTVATKQPAMTAPSMAARLDGIGRDEQAVEGFVDEVAHLLRSQMAGIVGNLALVVPVVLALQGLGWWWAGAPLVGETDAHYVLHSLDILGPSAFFAAFTGVLLFASSLIAGWVENWFVFQRLDSAIAWNPRSRALLGPERAQRWARWWRANVSGLAANTSLGLLLGLVPALGSFFGLPIEVRHVTLAMGQLAAALGALGTDLLQQPGFWRCLAAIPVIGALNLGVSFFLALRVALASRQLKLKDQARLRDAILGRLRRAPASFFWPPRG
ncbi:site-specific recombinase [Ideonella sp. 4Y16]|uniref:site-specific recombinase n=1 Tax=Ideonella alba TaxID=2824118 RepID=UPI001B395669|nr:site-specific recombinase [Ideonella alba]MBQ0945602.1 site-specific recombinase [Ideonella alba]